MTLFDTERKGFEVITYRVLAYVLSFTFLRLHCFTYFIASPFFQNYVTYQRDNGFQYSLGAIAGILLIGSMAGNFLRDRM